MQIVIGGDFNCVLTLLNKTGGTSVERKKTVLTFLPKFITSVNQAITQFVWNKTVKIKHKTMIGPKELGGLDLPDFDIINDSLKVTWVKLLNDSTETSIWSHIPLYYLQDVGGLFLLQSNFDLKLLKTDIPIDLYKEALKA